MLGITRVVMEGFKDLLSGKNQAKFLLRGHL